MRGNGAEERGIAEGRLGIGTEERRTKVAGRQEGQAGDKTFAGR